MADYVFERFSDDWARLINQTGLKVKMPPREGNEQYNCVWDAVVAPDGRLYFPMSSETGLSGVTTISYYDYDTNEVVDVMKGEKVLLQIPRQMPHSKFHTSLNIIPRTAMEPDAVYDPEDYLVIGTTHCTDKAPHQPDFMPVGHFNHPFEGFPGSQIVVYDPRRDQAYSLGTPVPRESIYGAKYDPKHNRLYMIGFFRGHVYSYDLNERRVTRDFGKMSEIFTYRLVLGADGFIYGCTKSGQMFRINTEEQKLENMEYRVPAYPDNYVNNTWYRYMVQGRNHASGKFMYIAFAAMSEMFKLDFETQTVTSIGSCLPRDGIYEKFAKDGSWHITGFDVDKDGVLWISILEWSVKNDTPYKSAFPCYLVRWDVEHGEEPFVCGLTGTPERIQEYVSEVEYEPKYDRLYYVNIATERPVGQDRPTAAGIDLRQFRQHYKERGPVSHDEYIARVVLTPEELEERQRRFEARGGEENSVGNPFAAFDPTTVTPVRIWRSLPRLEVDEAPVIGMAFTRPRAGEQYRLYAVSGKEGTFEKAQFVFTVADGKVTELRRMSEVPEEEKAWLRDNILPRPVDFDDSVVLPEATGRRYNAKAAYAVAWNGNRTFVGTKDSLAAIVSEDGSVFSLGNACAFGPVRCMVTNQDKTFLWGVAGDVDDLGYVFTYDDKTGLHQKGILNYNTYGYFDGPTASNVLSSIALSPDEKYLAIGGADRIATIHIIRL